MLEKGEQGLKKRIKYAAHTGVKGKPLAQAGKGGLGVQKRTREPKATERKREMRKEA